MKKLMVVKSAMAAASLIVAGCGQVDTGEVGLFTRWGKVVSARPEAEGIHFYMPIGTSLVTYDCRNQVTQQATDVFTKDIQGAKISLAVTYALERDMVIDLHVKTGKNYVQKLISPSVLGAVKNVVGQMEADSLVAKRKSVADAICSELKIKLEPFGIRIVFVEVLNIDYSDAFEKAVEQKQVAMQEAIKERNNTQRLQEVARQNVVRAEADAKAKVLNSEAEAKSILVKAEAEAKSIEMRNKALAQSRALIEYETVKAWDGKLPVQMLGNVPVPFLKLESEVGK